MSMKQVGERKHDSINKLFGYVCLLAREDVHIVFDDKYDFSYQKPKNVIISGMLFRTDSCHSSGRCCKVPFDLAYTHEGIRRIVYHTIADADDNLAELLGALKKVKTSCNGHEVEVHVHLNDKPARFTGTKTCDFLRKPTEGEFAGKFICGVHTAKPFHCWAPHFVVRQRDNSTSFISRMQFGRNHQFGCPVVFNSSLQYFEKDYQQDIDKLKWMEDIAYDLGIKTWIPQMIHWLEQNRWQIESMLKSGEVRGINISKLYIDQDEPALVSEEMFK